jgi:Ca2+:H+ antiporter
LPASSSRRRCWRPASPASSWPRACRWPSPASSQTSINLALGSALASIALTIPVITLIAAFTDVELALGVPPAKVALLVLAMFVSVITLLPGRTTVLHGVVHLGIFVMFLVVAAVP